MLFEKHRLFSLSRKTAKECKIYQMLKTSARKEKGSFHTPGHKLLGWDITELDYSDNLSCPNGCIKQAQEDVAALLRAEASFILTDGSTSGVLSMLYAAKSLGVKKIAVPYLSHKSVFNGCKLLGMQTVVFGKKNEGGIQNPPTRVEMKEALREADALFLTSPNYYGSVADLPAARALCDEQNKLLLIDGAHGGHLRFDKQKHAGAFADFWVDGVHKSLPAFTQGSVVSAKSKAFADPLREGVDMFRTTSPSYPIMASVEFAVKFPQNLRLQAEVEAFKTENKEYFYQNDDWTKLCLMAGNQAAEIKNKLQKQGIYAEFCDGETVMFYLSPAMKIRQFCLLKKALNPYLKTLVPYSINGKKKEIQRNSAPFVLQKTPTELVEIERSQGRICAKTFGLFPPCVPVVKEGEKIEKESIEKMQKANNVFGLNEGKALVYKEE